MTVAEKTKNEAAKTPHVERMVAVGAQYGYSSTRRHPSASTGVIGVKNRTEIINLDETARQLEAAKQFAEKLGREGKSVLLVGGKPEARAIVREVAESADIAWSSGRWIGGALTNFPEMKKRMSRLLTLREERDTGALSKYTKKERLLISREIAKLELNFEGLLPLNNRIPDALFVVDPREEKTAVAEAHQLRIPVIALMNTDCNAADAKYPILANDASKKSIEFFVREVIGAFRTGRAGKVETPKV